MEPDGAVVHVARASDDLSACSRKGEVAVTVRDRVGFYERNDLKVRDELETMARNEASSLAADTVQPLNQPSAGEQRFAAYQCGSNRPIARSSASAAQPVDAAPRQDEAETFPIRDE